jgi:hypothetical protein
LLERRVGLLYPFVFFCLEHEIIPKPVMLNRNQPSGPDAQGVQADVHHAVFRDLYSTSFRIAVAISRRISFKSHATLL